MDQTIDAAKIDEGAEVDDGGNSTFADLTLLQLGEEGLTDFGLGLLQILAAGQDHVVAVLVKLEDLGLDLLANVRSQITDTTHLDQRRGQEATQTDIDDQTALDGFDDGTFDHTIGFLDLLHIAPGAFVLSALLGEDETAFLVFLGHDQGFDGVADFDDILRSHVLLDGEFFRRNHTFGLVADVQENFVMIDLDDSALDQVTIVEVLDGGIDCLDEVIDGADVVDRHLFDFRFVICH